MLRVSFSAGERNWKQTAGRKRKLVFEWRETLSEYDPKEKQKEEKIYHKYKVYPPSEIQLS